MTQARAHSNGWNGRDVAHALARCLLGGMFVYLGVSKAIDPVGFLKLVREYEFVQQSLALNAIAALVPWFEVICGGLLLLGVAVRGTALLLGGMLVVFTALIASRAVAIHEAQQLAFCAVKFDCGCGAGEVLACRKLVENVLLAAVAALLVISRRTKFCVRPSLFRPGGL